MTADASGSRKAGAALPEYVQRLIAAHAASEEMDLFDLDSGDAGSAATGRGLTGAFVERQLELVAYVAAHREQIAAELEALRR